MNLPPDYIYRNMSFEQKETLYTEWCRRNQLDPNIEYSVEEFFNEIDTASTKEYQEDSTEKIDDSDSV